MLIISTSIGQKLVQTVFLIAISRPTGNKWQSKTLFLMIFDSPSGIVKRVLDCRLPSVIKGSQDYRDRTSCFDTLSLLC